MYSNRSYTEEQLQHSGHSKSTLDTSVNLNLKKKGINIGFLNIQGICGKEMVKFSEINLMLSSQENKKLHAFAMCETKLKDHKMSGAFKIKGFQTPFRKDNSSNGGGGIIVYVKNGIMAKRRQDLEDDNIEFLWVEITPTKGKPFLLGTVYRNPAERSDWLDRYENLIDKALTDKKRINNVRRL